MLQVGNEMINRESEDDPILAELLVHQANTRLALKTNAGDGVLDGATGRAAAPVEPQILLELLEFEHVVDRLTGFLHFEDAAELQVFLVRRQGDLAGEPLLPR